MYSESFIYRYKRHIVVLATVLFAVIVVWSVLIFVTRNGKVAVVISAVPSDSSITLDGTRYSNGTSYIQPGTYEIVVQKTGFETVKTQTTVTDAKEQNVIAVSLLPKSAQALKWADDHQLEYSKNETYGSIQANSDGKFFTSQNPITTKLPFKDPYFTIGYVSEGNNTIKLTIQTPSPRYRFFALEQIRKWGYDPTNFIIQFTDFNNPLIATSPVGQRTGG